MLFLKILPEVRDFCQNLRDEVHQLPSNKKSMTLKSVEFIGICITTLIVTGCLNWDKFERASCGSWKAKALSWMLHHSNRIPWDYILIASSRMLIRLFNIKKCHLLVDDFDRDRSKRTSKIYGTQKVRNKKGGGYVSAQNIVFLCVVTPKITFPIFAYFYRTDPVQKAWRKEDARLRKLKIPKKYRPKQPPFDSDYPSKKAIFVKLVRKFKYYFNHIKVTSIAGDSAYLSAQMKAQVQSIFPTVQFISQLRRNQSIMLTRKRSIRLDDYFKRLRPQEKIFQLRGHLKKKIYFIGARLFVKSHSKVSHIVAYRYEGEEKYRFICASELTWRSEDIIRAFAYRWLVEVVIEDFKQFDGWGKDASQYGIKGACRGLLLSLLLDHFLLQHPNQLRLYQTGKPLQTAGSLRNQLQFESLTRSIGSIVESKNPRKRLKEIASSINQLVTPRGSTKHMSGRDFEDLGPSPSLEAKFGRKTA